MWSLTTRFAPAVLMMGLTACTEAATVTGSASYRERIVLPPNAVFEATLSNSSIADVIVTPIGQIKLENMTGIPIEFAIPYDPGQIDERFSYSVRASIRVDGRLRFTTDTSYPVITRSNGHHVELLLKMVSNPKSGENQYTAAFGKFPASYEGVLPCADCPGIHYEVNLSGDHNFYLNLRYIDRDYSKYTSGQWQLSDDGATLTLRSDNEAPVYFAIIDHDTLRLLDKNGQHIESTLNYELQRFANE